MKFTIIAAHHKNIIGVDKDGKQCLPWGKISSDMNYFRETTKNGVVIVGRKTFETLPRLKDRIIIVISSRSSSFLENVINFNNFDDALSYAALLEKPIFVIGGGQLYKEAIQSKWCETLDITIINGPIDKVISGTPCAYFPEIPDHYVLSTSERRTDDVYILEHQIYKNSYDPKSQEYCYLNVLDKILSEGNPKMDRTTIGTYSLFGQILRFDFESVGDYYTFPLLTTKKMFLRGIVEELLFFLRGGVDNDILKAKNVHIWDGNTTREFLDNRGLHHFEEGSLGKAYGFQWRFWGAQWCGKNADYKNDISTGKSYDQIANIIKLLKTDPFSRRIVLSAWNVSDLDEMCLPPCHTLYVFNVQNDSTDGGKKKLYCHLTQRSGDMFLGVPFNIASASLLTFILAKVSGLEPGGLVISIVDAHIYLNHVEQSKKQVGRIPYSSPLLKIKKELSNIEDIETLEFEDFDLQSYKCHPGIKADMAI